MEAKERRRKIRRARDLALLLRFYEPVAKLRMLGGKEEEEGCRQFYRVVKREYDDLLALLRELGVEASPFERPEESGWCSALEELMEAARRLRKKVEEVTE